MSCVNQDFGQNLHLVGCARLKITSVVILTSNSTALEYATTKKYHQTTSLYLDQPPSYEYPPTYEEARIIKKYYKFTLVGQ